MFQHCFNLQAQLAADVSLKIAGRFVVATQLVWIHTIPGVIRGSWVVVVGQFILTSHNF